MIERRRVCVLSEDLSGAPDEGTKKFALSLASGLARRHDVALVTTEGRAPVSGAHHASASRTFLSRRLYGALQRLNPEVIIYAAIPSATFWSFLRSLVLKAYCPRATIVLVGLQARRHSNLQRRFIRYLAPDLVCVQALESKLYLERLGCQVELLPSGVDLETFRPVTLDDRQALRATYGLRPDVPVILHVGHLQPGRGIRVLAEIAAGGDCQVVLVTSSSTAHEAAVGLGRELCRAGVGVLSEYQPHIENFYQLADCYVFPVESVMSAIEVPLSVLEALACNLPVVTTRFGGLPQLLGGQSCPGLVFVDSPADIVGEARRLCRTTARNTRSLVLPYSWEAIADGLLRRALNGPRADA